jgi:hypothetical protein
MTFTTILLEANDFSQNYDENHKYMAFEKGTWNELNFKVENTWTKDRFNPAVCVTIQKGQGVYINESVKKCLAGFENIEVRCMQ